MGEIFVSIDGCVRLTSNGGSRPSNSNELVSNDNISCIVLDGEER